MVKWGGRGLCRLDSVLNEKRDQAEGTRLSMDNERKRKNKEQCKHDARKGQHRFKIK